MGRLAITGAQVRALALMAMYTFVATGCGYLFILNSRWPVKRT
jgi:hypothetical protein